MWSVFHQARTLEFDGTLGKLEETHPVMPGSGINHLVNLWKWKTIIGVGFVKVGEIHANPPFPTLFCTTTVLASQFEQWTSLIALASSSF